MQEVIREKETALLGAFIPQTDLNF
jgi:hypothetical protein